jgi:hypothetical protein
MVPNNANTFLPPVVTIPGSLLIIDITQSNQAVVTYIDASDNSYVLGQLVKLFIPSDYGMTQANGLSGTIVSLGVDTFTLDIDSNLFDAFLYPPNGLSQPASLSPAGSRNLTIGNSTQKVPFQSLNNIGN